MAFFMFFAFGLGCLKLVFSRLMAAAACWTNERKVLRLLTNERQVFTWAFLMLGPLALYSSLSPILRHTVKLFLWAGPDSSVSLYW